MHTHTHAMQQNKLNNEKNILFIQNIMINIFNGSTFPFSILTLLNIGMHNFHFYFKVKIYIYIYRYI